MRESLRAVLSIQARKAGRGHISNFFSRTHIGADTVLALSVTYLDDLYKETNDLFWKTTGYKVGQKLNPSNPDDAKMIPAWSSLFTQIKTAHVNKDTNTNFWNQTGYKVGQKLDPKIAADKAKIPIWLSINTNVKAAYDKLPRTPTGIGTTVADAHVVQAQTLQAQADTHKAESAGNAKVAIEAAAAGDTAKAEVHTALSNSSNEKAQAFQEQADVHKDIAKQLADINSLSGLAYLAVKAWASTPNHSRYFGWAIKEDGTVDTKWTDDLGEIKSWFDGLGFNEYIWGLYYDSNNKNADGIYLPVEQYTPTITQLQADNALNNALGKPKAVVSLKDVPAPQPKSGGGGGAIALMLTLGGGIAMAAASGKKR